MKKGMKKRSMKKTKKGGVWYSWGTKTLKTKINDYIYKHDICCEKEINRKILIRMITEHYKKMCQNNNEPEEYLNWIANDLVKFIGYRNSLEKENKAGLELWDEIDKQTTENKKSSEKKIRDFLENVPYFFLLAFLGYSDYIEKSSQNNRPNPK